MQISLRDIVDVFHVSEKTIHQWITKGKMPCVKVNDQYHFNYTGLLEWALANKITLTPEALALGEKENGAILPFYQALKNGGVHYDVPGQNRQEILQSLVERLPMPPQINKNDLLSLLLKREEIMSTAIGGGIAIPHVRNPVVLHVQESCVSLCFLSHPVDFNALDGKPVSIVFGLLSASVKEHLSILARLAYCLQNEFLQQLLKTNSQPEEIMAEIRVLESQLAVKEKKGP